MNKMLAKDEVKKEQLHLARLLGEKKKNNCSWWNLLGVVS